MRLLTGNYLFTSPVDNPSGYFLALTIAFGVLFVLCALAYWRRAKLAPNNPIRRRLIRRVAKAGMWEAGIGLFLALMRYVQFPFLSEPILLLLLIIAMIVTVGFFVYDLSEHYPMAMYRVEEAQMQRRFRPTARPATVPQKPKPRVRGKRKR